MDVSIRFNTARALAECTERRWSLAMWADRARCSPPTLRAFLNGDPKLKNSTVDQILLPLGLCALDIVILPQPRVLNPEPVLVGE
jgi:hypothetical protein